MPVAHEFRAFANSSNMLLFTKIVTISSMGIFAGTALNYNTVVMPSLRKFASSSSLAVWAEMYLLAKRNVNFLFVPWMRDFFFFTLRTGRPLF